MPLLKTLNQVVRELDSRLPKSVESCDARITSSRSEIVDCPQCLEKARISFTRPSTTNSIPASCRRSFSTISSHHPSASTHERPPKNWINQNIPAPSYGLPSPRLTGTKRGLLIGINYPNSKAPLTSCHNDVKRFESFLRRKHFTSIVKLVDDGRGDPPTRLNIIMSCERLVRGAQPGDILFFHFSGHASQQRDKTGIKEGGLKETILPSDFEQTGTISDDALSEILVNGLPDGCQLIAVLDCPYTGMGLDLPFTIAYRKWKRNKNVYRSLGDVVCFSACQDSQTAAEAGGDQKNVACLGPMTGALTSVIGQQRDPISYAHLLCLLKKWMRVHGFQRTPTLTSTQVFPLTRCFMDHEIYSNQNREIGFDLVQLCKPKKPKPVDGVFGELLAAAGLGVFSGETVIPKGRLASNLFDIN